MNLLLKFGIVLLIAFVVLATLSLIFWARPTPLLGLDRESLTHSFEKSDSCRKGPGDDWTCSITADGPPTRYVVDVDWMGCWDADRTSGPINAFKPREISGCVNLQDHLRLEDALN